MGDNNSFGNEPDDETRFNSALTYWKRFEKNADLFWTDALDITKDEKLGKEMLEKLFDHLNKFPMFKIDNGTNVDLEKGYQKTRLEKIKEAVDKDEEVEDDVQVYDEEDDVQVYEEEDDEDEKEEEDNSNMNLDQ